MSDPALADRIERIARIMWTAFASEGTYDEDRHGDRAGYLATARAIVESLRGLPEPTWSRIRMACGDDCFPEVYYEAALDKILASEAK